MASRSGKRVRGIQLKVFGTSMDKKIGTTKAIEQPGRNELQENTPFVLSFVGGSIVPLWLFGLRATILLA